MRHRTYPECMLTFDSFAHHPDWEDGAVGGKVLALDCHATFASVYPEKSGIWRGFVDDDAVFLHKMMEGDTLRDTLYKLYEELRCQDRLSPCARCLTQGCPHDDCTARITWDDMSIDTPECHEVDGTWRCAACGEELDEDWLESELPPDFCPGCGRRLAHNPFARGDDEHGSETTTQASEDEQAASRGQSGETAFVLGGIRT